MKKIMFVLISILVICAVYYDKNQINNDEVIYKVDDFIGQWEVTEIVGYREAGAYIDSEKYEIGQHIILIDEDINYFTIENIELLEYTTLYNKIITHDDETITQSLYNYFQTAHDNVWSIRNERDFDIAIIVDQSRIITDAGDYFYLCEKIE